MQFAENIAPSFWFLRYNLSKMIFQTAVPLAPSHVSSLGRPSESWSVRRHTFEFPSPLNIPWQQSSLMTPRRSFVLTLNNVYVCSKTYLKAEMLWNIYGILFKSCQKSKIFPTIWSVSENPNFLKKTMWRLDCLKMHMKVRNAWNSEMFPKPETISKIQIPSKIPTKLSGAKAYFSKV